ncbi:glycosyl hydrolases family 31-domain-containing protein [Apiosordaria backusii]|uniref:alpha-glucosidase n=1 Tax=Apiosordaria backusii TaxID=314023 RepID=A0AA40A6W8_9PEZI|nr:glycosyl hydrolases family 31-domain-containing protein [Apiosordaria backusii]
MAVPWIASLVLLLAWGAWGQVEQCPGYEAINVLEADSYLIADLVLIGNCSSHSDDIENLRLLVEYQTDTDYQAFQIQEHVLPRPKSQNATSSTSGLQFSFTQSPFSFTVTRASTGDILFDTADTPLIFETQYVRLRTRLPSNPNIYGLGEHSDDFRLPTTKYTRTLWNAESPMIPARSNLYGAHPVYFDHRGKSGTHGVFLLSSNGMDIKLDATDQGQQYLEYNAIGGVLDFYFLAGPDPADVSKQYAEVVGLPALVPYWALGFHQCKYGYKKIDDVAQVVANYSAAGIPLETMWGDIDYMDAKRDFTTNPVNYTLDKVQQLVRNLHNNGQHYVQILDPGIHRAGDYSTYLRGAQKEVFLKADDGSFYRGIQWPGEVVWPDWFHPNTQEWWTDEIKRFYDANSGVNVDGLWVDMNEASNMCETTSCFTSASAQTWTTRNGIGITKRYADPIPFQGVPNRDLFNPKYRIQNHRPTGDISANTLYTNITNADGTHQYDTHNLYGTMMATATRNALLSRNPNLRPFVLTRSTFAGAGRVAAHWFGDNASRWDYYRITIRQLLSFASMHAMPFVGSDVCGFNERAQENMCARWALLGAFQPFYRNHADTSAPPQEFYLWPSVTQAAKKAIDTRYKLLDYMYTFLWKASTDGTPIASPLWFFYPSDSNTFGIQTQWMLGDALLISPVVEDDSQSVNFYLPDDIWYDFWTFKQISGGGQMHRLDGVKWDEIPVHIRGGTILAMRTESGNTTSQVRSKNFRVIVAPGRDGTARGELYLDDGVSLDVGGNRSEIVFSWDGQAFTANGTFGYETDVKVERVVILGGEGGEVKTEEGPWGLRGGFGFRL